MGLWRQLCHLNTPSGLVGGCTQHHKAIVVKGQYFFITLDKHHCLYFVGLKGKKDHALQISRQVLIGSLDVPKLNIFSHAIPVLLTRAVWGPMHSMPRLFQDAPRFCLLQFIIRKSVIKVSGIPTFMVPTHP